MAGDRAGRRQELLLALMRDQGFSAAAAMVEAHKLSAFVESEHLAGATADLILVFDQWDNLLGTAERVGETAKDLEVRNMRLLVGKMSARPTVPRYDMRGLLFKLVSYRGASATTWDGVSYAAGDTEVMGRILWIKDGLFSIPPEARRTEGPA